MSNKHFAHLHLHTEYSLLDGAITIDRLIEYSQKLQFKSLAITDHGNIFGAVKFFQKCKKAGIKPILGIEAYLTPDARIKNSQDKYHHLILLVQNQEGYRNLCKLISFSFQEGFYFKPRIDYEQLQRYSAGLIATSACLGGHIPSLLMDGNDAQAIERLDWFVSVFGKDRFYLEVHPEDQADQKILNQKLYNLSATYDVNLIAAADCHYLTPQDREAHEIMLAIQTHDTLDNPDRYTFGDCRVHVRSQDEMCELFSAHEDAIWNTGKVADLCDFSFSTGKIFFPQFAIPPEHTSDSYFREICAKGLEKLVSDGFITPELSAVYEERLKIEVDLIITMGFVGYFLVVSDFIQWAHRQEIPVGPGRGSAAGSLVAWALQITNIDPLKYNLLFERFLNPERISMPDIDIDFCIEGRERVINYVRDKYGHDKVCHIITFGTMLAKGVIKDVARALGLPFEDSQAITTLIPDQLKISLQEALEQEPRLRELIDKNPKVAKIFDIAFRLEGITRHASKHAAGIVISPDPIDTVLPVYIPPKTTDLVAQYSMTELETLGFLKMDLLGLKNLTLIDRVVRLIKKDYAITLDINRIPLDNPSTFALIGAGNTSGIFQLESTGLKEVLRKLRPEKFEDIIAVNALYRPGPLGSGMVDDYIERRHGKQKISYIFPELESVLAETYGVIVYQEQVMKIASLIGSYSLGEADILRRAMGKKKAEEMEKQRAIFVSRATTNNFAEKKAAELFDLMAFFAGYGFNKSHSAAYALIAYQTAYLKANYPAQFMACLISLEATDTDKMSFYLQEAKDMHIPILPPNINKSDIHFSVVEGSILFGLLGIKNVGMIALENIITERTAQGPFKDLLDVCKRLDLRTANKRVLENLICSGACDGLPGYRSQKYHELSSIMEHALAIKKDLSTGQLGLFSPTPSSHTQVTAAQSNTPPSYQFELKAEWPEKEKLEKEKEAIGFYVSSHPLDHYQQYRSIYRALSFEQGIEHAKMQQYAEKPFIFCGILKTHKTIITKKGDRMAFLGFEDQTGKGEVILFPRIYAQVETIITNNTVFIIKGTLDTTQTTLCKIKALEIAPVEQVLNTWSSIERISLTLVPNSTHWSLPELQSLVGTPGKTTLEIIFPDNGTTVVLVAQKKIGVIGLDLEKKYSSIAAIQISL